MNNNARFASALRAATLTLVVSLVPASFANAEPLSLAQAMSDLSLSPRIRQANSALEEASWKRVESYSKFLPSLNAGANRVFDVQYVYTDLVFGGAPVSVPGIIPTTTYSLTAEWNLFEGLGGFERWQSAKQFESAARSEYEWTRFKSERELILLYYKALASKTLREVAEQNVKALQDHRSDTQLFKKAGVSTNFDLLRVEVQLSEAQSEVASAKDDEVLSVLRLGDLTNQGYQGREVVGPLPVLQPKLIEKLNSDTSGRKDLEALDQRARALGKVATAAESHWVPRVSLFGQYQNYNNKTNTWSGDDFRDAHTYGLTLTWNLFDGFGSMARANEAVEQKAQAEYALAQVQNRSRTDLEFWKRKYAYFSAVYQSRLSDVAKSTESVRLAREGRRVGSRTNTDLLDAESELFRAKAGLVNSQIGAIEALIQLELSTGRKLYEFE